MGRAGRFSRAWHIPSKLRGFPTLKVMILINHLCTYDVSLAECASL